MAWLRTNRQRSIEALAGTVEGAIRMGLPDHAYWAARLAAMLAKPLMKQGRLW